MAEPPPPPAPIVAAGEAIEVASFRHIDASVADRSRYDDRQWPLVRRLIHTSGDFDFNGLTRFHPRAMEAGIAALAAGRPVTVDVAMIRAGLTPRRLLPLGIAVHQFNADPEVVASAVAEGTTRTVQAMRTAWRRGLLTDAIIAIGNAPTALLEVIRLIDREGLRPALVIGFPVGFIRAAESKESLSQVTAAPWITIDGTKGGSTLVVAALHTLMDLALEVAKR
ncbi:MAG: precorrin-8X methylmutase [Magnetococcales bacterium]|nr:precorrin-8X methylmutase [Magnetococcales bacterium]